MAIFKPNNLSNNGTGGGSSSADKISYDNSISQLTATNVQNAVDEVNQKTDLNTVGIQNAINYTYQQTDFSTYIYKANPVVSDVMVGLDSQGGAPAPKIITSLLNLPISDATQAALNNKIDAVSPSANIAGVNNQDTGKTFGNDGTNNTVPTSLETKNEIIQQFLNIPNLGVVAFATTANDTLTGLAARDGYTPIAGDVALAKNQTNGDQSFWITASGAWTRAYFNLVSKTFVPITVAQTTYQDLNIANGIVFVANGGQKNSQFQISVLKPSVNLGTNTSSSSPAVLVTATTKLSIRDLNNGFVSNGIGNNTNNNGTPSFPYATVTQDQIGAQYPHITTVRASGSNYNENLNITTATPNLTVICPDSAEAGKCQFSQTVTINSGTIRYREVGITRSTGANPPVTTNGTTSAILTFENAIWTTSGTVLINLLSSMSGWLDINNLDATGSPLASIVLPNFTSPFTINFKNQNKPVVLTLASGSTGVNCTINLIRTPRGAVFIPPNFAGTINYDYDAGLNVNQIINNQATLDSILANTSLNGYYVVNFDNPVGMPKGCIFYKYSAGGFTVNNIAETFIGAPPSIYDYNTESTWSKGNGFWNNTNVGVYLSAKYSNNGSISKACTISTTSNTVLCTNTANLENNMNISGTGMTLNTFITNIIANTSFQIVDYNGNPVNPTTNGSVTLSFDKNLVIGNPGLIQSTVRKMSKFNYTIAIDKKNKWNNLNNSYIIPETGNYIFTLTIQIRHPSNNITSMSQIIVNGNPPDTMNAVYGIFYNVCSVRRVLSLNINDIVEFVFASSLSGLALNEQEIIIEKI